MPNEFLERYFPLLIERYETEPDSGGAGLHRGGNGIHMTYRFLASGTISIHDDRWFVPPWGVNGGEPGKRARKILEKADGSSQIIGNKVEDVHVDEGDQLHFITWGGGGWGDPLERDPALVGKEITQGLVTVEGAKAYGVIAAADGASGMPDIIIPRKCIGELRKLLDEIDGSVEVSLSASKIRFGLGTAVLTSKLIDGTFPDYSRVIPTGNDKILRIDPKSFMEGVDRVSTIASEKTRAVKMALETDKITLSVTSPENGTAAEEVSGDYKSDGFEIGFNARYLMDILAQVEGDTVEVHLADAAAPTLIRENDKAGALYVLMPMRV